MKRFSLRVFLPLLVTVFFLVVTLVAFGTSRHFVLEELQAGLQQETRTRLHAVQGTLERFLSLDSLDGVKSVISASGSELDLRVQFVSDGQGRVLSSTVYLDEGAQWKDLDYTLDAEVIDRVTRTRTSEVVFDRQADTVNGYISVCDPNSGDGLRIGNCGFLFHQIDLRFHRDKAIDSLYQQASLTMLGFAISAMLLMYAVHRMVTARVTRMHDALGRFAQGEQTSRVAMHGQDELADIGRRIDDVLDHLALEEEALRGSERFKRTIIDGANASIVSMDGDGRILTFSAGSERMLGYRAEELVGLGSAEVFHDPEEISRRACQLSHELQRPIHPGIEALVAKASLGEVDENEWTYIRKDGSRLTVDLSIAPLTDDAGQINAFVGVARDISATKAMVQGLRLAEQVFKGAGEAILVTDADNRIIDANPAYLAMTGYERRELIGETPRVAKSGRHDDEFYRSMWRSIAEAGSWSGELWNRRKDGEVFPQWLTINEIRDDAGKVTHYVGIFKDITQQKEAEERLQRMAYYDPLTSLPNRTLFRDRLEHEIAVARRNQARVALLFIDLDGFKYVNDNQGHDAGDQVLSQAALRICSQVRESDTVARLGGDEFTVTLGGLGNAGDASRVSTNIIDALTEPFATRNARVQIGASIGIAIYPDDGEDFQSLTRNADAAMYRAKQTGRGTHRFFGDILDSAEDRRRELEASLRTALQQDEFRLFYQPQLDMRDGRVLGFEALLRWHPPALGIVPPAEFIAMAEQNGLIVSIGAWVLHEAAKQLQQWRSAGFDDLRMAINLSVRQLDHPGLVDQVEHALADNGLPGGALELELTESMLMKDAERAITLLRRLRELGISLAIDDFGTGHSSLSYLKRLPVQTLKIDRSFVHDIATDPNDVAIIRAVLSMAKQLNLQVVAEGVESPVQHDFLLGQGCRVAQGYLYAKPMSADDATAFLRGNAARAEDIGLPAAR